MRRHLSIRRKRICDLKDQYTFLSKKIQHLEIGKIAESKVSERFDLEYEIEMAKKDLHEIEQELELLERSEIRTIMHTALLKLNYQAQAMLFRQLIKKSQVGAFLIHGEPEYGQRWLLKRLVRQVRSPAKDRIIEVVFSSGRSWDFNAILREIGRQVDLRNPSLEDFVKRIHNCWQTQTVILIFDCVSAIDRPVLREIKEKLWHELVNKSTRRTRSEGDLKLLMFLVDDSGQISQWPFDYAEQLDTSWTPVMPIKPPVIAPIEIAELESWIHREIDNLPDEILDILDISPQDFLQQTNGGIPQCVLEYLWEMGSCELSELRELCK